MTKIVPIFPGQFVVLTIFGITSSIFTSIGKFGQIHQMLI